VPQKPTIPPNADDPAESKRFIDMAREVEVDESPGALERALEKVIKTQNRRSVRSRDQDESAP